VLLPRATTFIRAQRLVDRLGIEVTLASETFQHTGSFKYRAAHRVACARPQRHLIAASSGNFGQALAAACAATKKQCTIVMPSTSSQVKVEATRSYGAEVQLIDVDRVSRVERLAELSALFPSAFVVSATDDPDVIEGNATLGAEIAELSQSCDVVVAPVGGGALAAGIIVGLRREDFPARVVGAEPSIANDAARSLRAGRRVTNDREPRTLADGARSLCLGARSWEILEESGTEVVEVSELAIALAVRLLFSHANLKAEPTGALAIAALLAAPEQFRERSCCCVVTGGNVDSALYCSLISSSGDL
jgi:threonine dehydratase